MSLIHNILYIEGDTYRYTQTNTKTWLPTKIHIYLKKKEITYTIKNIHTHTLRV